MATAKRLRRQAATCATLARQAHDEEISQRYLRLQQIYLQLADTQDQIAGRMSEFSGASERQPAA